MDPVIPVDEPGKVPDGRAFHSRGDFLDAWRFAMEQIAEQGCRELYFCDSDFADWPLGEQRSIELLNLWAMSHRKLVVLGAQFETLQRIHPRWVTWRRSWSHMVHCRQVAEADASAIPSMLLAPGLLSLRVHDPVHFRGRLSFTRPEEVRDWDDIDSFLQRSHDSFPVTNLGL